MSLWHDDTTALTVLFQIFYVFILIKGFDDNISADENVLEAAADEELISDGIQSAYQMIWAGNSQNMSSAASAMLLKNPRAENFLWCEYITPQKKVLPKLRKNSVLVTDLIPKVSLHCHSENKCKNTHKQTQMCTLFILFRHKHPKQTTVQKQRSKTQNHWHSHNSIIIHIISISTHTSLNAVKKRCVLKTGKAAWSWLRWQIDCWKVGGSILGFPSLHAKYPRARY